MEYRESETRTYIPAGAVGPVWGEIGWAWGAIHGNTVKFKSMIILFDSKTHKTMFFHGKCLTRYNYETFFKGRDHFIDFFFLHAFYVLPVKTLGGRIRPQPS